MVERAGTIHCIALHCIGQNGFLKLLDDDEGMEMEVLLIELHMYAYYSVHEERKMVLSVQTKLLCYDR